MRIFHAADSDKSFQLDELCVFMWKMALIPFAVVTNTPSAYKYERIYMCVNTSAHKHTHVC